MGLVEGEVTFASGVTRAQGRSRAMVADAGRYLSGNTFVCDAGLTAR